MTGTGGTFVIEEIGDPAPGAYTIAWDITGHVDGLAVSAKAEMCQPA